MTAVPELVVGGKVVGVDRCSTCGSVDRAVRLVDDPGSYRGMLCPADWHMVPRDVLLAFELRCNGELIGEERTHVRLAPGDNAFIQLRPVNRIGSAAYLRVMLVIDGEEVPGWWTYRVMVDLDGQPRDATYRPGRIFAEPADVGSLVHFPPRWRTPDSDLRHWPESNRALVRFLEDGMWTLSVRVVQ